jgi:hypothetical protein
MNHREAELKKRNEQLNPHWREEAVSLGVNPDDPDDFNYWTTLERARAIVDSFHYHQPTEEQIGRISRVRCGAIDFAKIVLQNVKTSADQTHALRTIHEAMMTANKGIVTEKKL